MKYSLTFIACLVSANSFQLPKQLSEDGRLNFTQLSAKYSHPSEQYHVTTEDGYILTLFRLPGNISQPVLLQHGLFSSSDDFISRGKTSFGIILAENGYDVWLGNSRGNRYSRRHVTLNPDTDPLFFDYSFEEFGYYDTPAIIDFIMKVTGQKKLSAIGHSEGNTIFYVLGSRKPEYNKKIKVFIALAPVCFFNHTKPPLSVIMDISPLRKELADLFKQTEILGENSLARQLLVSLCTQPVIGYEICVNAVAFNLFGNDAKQFEPDFLPTFIGHFPIASSVKNLYHLAQLRLRRTFAMYDYGIAKNIQRYRSRSPPEYNLRKVNMKIVLVAGKNDKLVSLADVDILNQKLPNVVEYIVMEQESFNHIDFVVGRDNYKVLFPRLIQILEKYNEK